MAAPDSLRDEARRPRSRKLLWDRPQPAQPFIVLRKRRRGFLPELTPNRKGQVYVASCDGLEAGLFKIGKSTDHFSRRSQALSQPTGVPGFYYPVYRLETDAFDELEIRALGLLQAFRLHRRKEFVACSLEEIVRTLQILQREAAPSAAFNEHFYFPIEDLNGELRELYEDLLLHPGPGEWPRICLYLSLSSGLSPREIFLALQDEAEELDAAFPPSGPDRWLAEYLRSLMRYEKLPFGRELAWLWPCCSVPGEEAGEGAAEEIAEAGERWDWFFRQWEEDLWDGVESVDLLRKIQASVIADSPAQLCALVHRKAQEYASGRPDERGAATSASRCGRDFHFI